MRLSAATLPYIASSANAEIEIPSYDRNLLKAGIVHFGPGNFPMAHMAEKTHALMQSGDKNALNYGIVGVSLQTPDRRNNLTPQDGLYTVVEQDESGKNKMKIVGSVKTVLFAPDGVQAVIDQVASPETRIVSMTITPQVHQSYMTAEGHLNLAHPDIANDLNPKRAPKTVFGYIVRGFQKRVEQGLPGFTVMNLDNMEHNGQVLGRLMREFTAAYDSQLLPDFDAKMAFPNSMVDRIVPKTTPELLNKVAQVGGYSDASAVPAEPMPSVGSWVIEDKFVNGRPAWEKRGLAQIVPDVLPYEKMKLRLLNASHAGIANLGDLLGYKYIDETLNDERFQKYMSAMMDNETGPTLSPVPGIDLKAYKAELISRFANRAVKDTTWRVAKDAPLKVVLDSAQDQLANGRSVELLGLAASAWMRRFRVDTNEMGARVDVAHPMADLLKAKAKEGGNDPGPMFGITEVFGSIGQDQRFVSVVAKYMAILDQPCGVEKAMDYAVALSNEAAATCRPCVLKQRKGAKAQAAPSGSGN